MEDFKDVMLSEPPQRFATNPQPHATSNALSLESYKGILLCDRPADVRGVRAGYQLPPFLPPGSTDMDRGNGNLGLQPSLETRSKHTTMRTGRGESQARSKHTALSKHRKWLQSFATEMKKMKENQSEQEIQATIREATLRDREARKRRGDGSVTSPNTAEYSGEEEAIAASSNIPELAAKAAKPKKKAAEKKKPKWAMTEEEAEDAEFAEARDLVDFAAELDYDSFMKDFEVQEALAIMRDRVREIAAEKGIDIDAERLKRAERDDDEVSVVTTSTTNPERRAMAAVQKKLKKLAAAADGDAADDRPGWDDSTKTSIRKALQGDAMKLAERVLQSSEELRKVHSKMSMAKLLEDVAMELNAGQTQRKVMLPAETGVLPPRVTILAAESTGSHGAAQPQKRILTEMRHSKSQAQNLPYLYRCPSI